MTIATGASGQNVASDLQPTIAARLAACRNRPSGFDYLRITLAILVVVSHVSNLTLGLAAAHADWTGPLRPALAAILPMFFALSGFLVAGSMVRCQTLFGFAGLRIIRLAPALVVDTAVSGLIIGPLLTTLPLGAYFTDPLFLRYWGNLVGHVQFFLPGVFETHPSTYVNGQLWTLPWELVCYLALALLWLTGAVRHRLMMLIAALAVGIGNALYWMINGLPSDPYQTPGLLVASFLTGVVFYQYRDQIRLSRSTLVTCVLISALLLVDAYNALFAFLPLAYVTVHLGMTNPRRWQLLSYGDYSYGFYLYAYPLQQVVVALAGPTPGWRSLLLSLPLIAIFAVFSWWCVERPAMTRLRPVVDDWEVRWTAARARLFEAIRNRRGTAL